MAQYDINLREYWRILKKRKFIVVFTAVVLGFFSTFFAILKAPTPIYSSVSSIRFEKETTVEGLYAKTISWSSGDDIETQVSVIRSYSVLKEVAEKMGLIPRRAIDENETLKANIISLVERLQGKVSVSRESYTNILNIEVIDTDPAFAQKLANTIALTYKEIHSKQQLKRTSEAIRYIEDQLKTVQDRLRESEDAFNRFSQENQLISIDLQSENLLARAQEIENEIRALQENRRELEGVLGRLKAFVEKPSGSDHNFYSSKAGNQYQTTNDALVGLLLKKETLLEDYTPQHPEVIGISRKIVENGRKMVILLELQIRNLQDKQADLGEEARKIAGKTNVLMEKKLEYDRLKRKVESYNDMTALLERKNQEALIRQAEKPEEITIVRPGLLATSPINPPRTATTGALGVLIGLILGLVTAFIVETLDTSLGAIEDVEETLGAQVLGVIPHADAKVIQESLSARYPESAESSSLMIPHLVSHFSPNSMIAESFRALRTNIQFKEAGDKIKTVAVTSASPQEGKTLASVNLAITMAQAGMKTLLVGSDMRKPMLARIFGVEMAPGLTDVLLGNHPWQDTVKGITDLIMGKMTLDEIMMTPGLDNLHLITSGAIPPNPAILIESRRLETFIKEAEKAYDLIIFDSPPILSTADAAILGSKMDGVLLVYRVGAVSKGLLKRSSTQLEQVKCNILGVILNGMKPEISPDFQDFKYYKYYYSYGGDDKKGKDKKKRFALIRGKGGGRGKEKARDSRTGGSLWLRAVLMIAASGLLGTGLLWQNGIIHPLEWLDPGETAGKGPVPAAEAGEGRRETLALDLPKGEEKGNGTEELKRPVAEDPPVSGGGEAGREAVSETTPLPPLPVSSRDAGKEPEDGSLTAQRGEEGPEEAASIGTGAAEVALNREPEGEGPEAPPGSQPIGEGERTGAAPGDSRPYALYLGSFRTLDRARKAVLIYREKGLSPYWSMVDFKDKGIWYRVYAGHFREQEEAMTLGSELGLEEVVAKRTRYASQIGVFGDGDALESGIGRLEALGYSPYVIEDREGKSRLLVGAYITLQGAERQQEELKADGVEAQVVRR